MNILISGAGIAGLTAAYWLHQSGHICTVIEQSPTIRTEGYMIDFGGSGWDVAHQMGLIPELESRQHHVNEIHYIKPDGTIATTIDIKALYDIAAVAGKFLVLNRRDVVEALYQHVRDYTKIDFDMSIRSIKQTSDTTHVTFSNGSSEMYDLVIGADGIHSNVRKIVFGEEQQFTKYLGYHFSIFIIPALKPIPDGYNMYLEPGIQISIYPIKNDQWMIFVTIKNEDPTIPIHAERNAYLKNRLKTMGWISADIGEAITDETYIFYDTITQIVNPVWSKNRVVLIGDAAHCPTLVSGQGASMAMAGAYFLNQSLSKNDTLTDALLDYDAVLRPHIDRIQQKAKTFAPNFVPSSQWRIYMVQWITRLISLPIVKNIVGKQFSVNSVIPSDQSRNS